MAFSPTGDHTDQTVSTPARARTSMEDVQHAAFTTWPCDTGKTPFIRYHTDIGSSYIISMKDVQGPRLDAWPFQPKLLPTYQLHQSSDRSLMPEALVLTSTHTMSLEQLCQVELPQCLPKSQGHVANTGVCLVTGSSSCVAC
jgi:hypothetical protein